MDAPQHNSAASRIRVMVVDDSAIIRGLMSRVLKEDPELEVVASAAHGIMAISVLKQVVADVILLDIEMPEMDGITALPQLLEMCPNAKIIMVSTLTRRNAEISLKALQMGACDYLPKPTSRSENDAVEQFYAELVNKVKFWGKNSSVAAGVTLGPVSDYIEKGMAGASDTSSKSTNVAPPEKEFSAPSGVKYPSHPVKAIAIASSTGGPQALLKLFGNLKGKLTEVPVFITQHMPPTFTTMLCDHLGKACEKPCAEGTPGALVKAGHVYMAPGDYHMRIINKNQPIVELNQDPPENFCRPSADPMLRSLADVYGSGLLLAVLTGMGHDGLAGAREVIKAGGSVIAQDEQSSVVWGMPRAVAEDGICNAVLPLDDIAAYLMRAVGER